MDSENILFQNNAPYQISALVIERVPLHWHESVTEIVFPIRGEIEVVSNFEHITLKEGDFSIINHRSVHSIQSKNKATVISIHINIDQFELQFPYIKYMSFRSNSFFDNHKEYGADFFKIDADFKVKFRNLLLHILFEYLSGSQAGNAVDKLANQLVYTLVFEFNWLKQMKIGGAMLNPAQLDRYHRIVRYIYDHFAERITLDDVVSSEYVTKTYFSHFWKELSSYSFTERVNYERVIKSQFLLLESKNISKISEQCGFSDVKYYYQNFKRWFGCMPLEHRQHCIAYQQLGSSWHQADLSKLQKELDEYLYRFMMIRCETGNGDQDASYTENYMNLKLLNNTGDLTTAAVKYLIISPFRQINYLSNTDETFVFNWHYIDQSVNLSLDAGLLLYVDLCCDNVEPHLLSKVVCKFLDICISRYGFGAMKKWHFFINYKNFSSFDKNKTIEKLILSKVANANVCYSFEL